ncbi:MAG: SgcJ/EcaC family oxidoreductase [Candidatus Bathyarchaeota archaeon]|nr:SgcJ/EcaC family oxidoreductase [Candidatus Bathyarchaeota archaeon]
MFETPINRLNDEAAIRKLGEAYDVAWNRGDVQALISSFTPDAIVVNPRGEVTTGKMEFKQSISNLLSGSFKRSTHKSKILRIHFLKNDVAVVDGEATLTLLKPLEGNSKLTHHYTDVMIKEGNRWLIADTRAYVFMEN